MNIAAIIIGIDGWEQYTLPLVRSIEQHEPECGVVVVDNASAEMYPALQANQLHANGMTWRTERLCYSAAINYGAQFASHAGWLVVLSNDVLCTGPFAHMLAALPDDRIVGPHYISNIEYFYLEGWCVCIPRRVWDTLGGWDENFWVSSWDDVDYSHMAREAGFEVQHMPELPFVHLDQRQRHQREDFFKWDIHNYRYFREKRERVKLQAGWRRLPATVYP